MLILEFLKTHTLEKLAEDYAVSAKRHKVFPNLVLLKYNQLKSPLSEPLVQECRGLILDEADGWKVVARPYDKFFNYGEGQAAPIDWSSAKVYEKLDGSLITLYFYKGSWRAATSGTPDASGELPWDGTGVSTFESLFWDIWKELGYAFPKNESLCYMFELLSHYNRVVVRYTSNRIVLHGVRSLQTMKELDPQTLAFANNWECVKSFPMHSFEEILKSCESINPMSEEGYVVCDSNFNRNKIKAPQYVAVAHLKDGFSQRRLLDIVRANEEDEVISYFPEFKKDFEEITEKFRNLVSSINEVWEQIKTIENRKDFAAMACKAICPGALFSLKDGKVKSAEQFLKDMDVSRLLELLKVREIIQEV
jgi:hypothetical protein